MNAVGVDGCPDGWVCVHRVPGAREITGRVVRRFATIAASFPSATIAIDIPIGLPDVGSRACDVAARKLLKARGSCVFPAPIRPILEAADYDAACRIGREVEHKAISCQTFGILDKIREVDEVVTPESQNRVFEVHPEVSFCALNGKTPLLFSKGFMDGVRERVALLYPAMLNIGTMSVGAGARTDDILDAAVALWSAERIIAHLSGDVCACKKCDGRGLRMQITY